MDIQVKRGILEACVLAVLLKEDSYGYKLMEDVREYIDISESTLYPVLKRLETVKKLRVYSVEHNGRLRKYYQITPRGKLELENFVNDWGETMRVYEFIRGGLKHE